MKNDRRPHALPISHLLLALAVTAVWGTNFTIIKVAVAHFPPLFLATLRFTLALLPAALVLPRPRIDWRLMAAYGVLIGVGQFALLYIAIRGFISPGLASLVIQTQVFFTIGLAMAFSREHVRAFQWMALLLAAAGIAVIGMHTGGDTTLLGLLLVLGAALSWASGNIVGARAGGRNMFAFVVWSSAFAVPPLLALALAVDGWNAIRLSIASAPPSAWAAAVWQAWGNTLFGYGCWAWLLARHPAATVTPMALLVPVFGVSAAAALLDEPLPAWKLEAGLLVVSGLALSVLWPRWRAARGRGLPVAADAAPEG
jgi:O-acetylserine/cysteine efflux transporter